jgi:glycosyltransferase involved in cell wall biosynthesis
MRIGIEAQRIFRTKKHGMDMVALELIKNIQQIDTTNEYVVFVKEDEDNSVIQETPNVKIVKVKSASYPVWEQLHLPDAVKKYGVDLLHCTSNTAPIWLSVPLVLTLHDIIYLEKISLNQGTSYQKFGNIYRRLIVPKIVPKAKRILTVSNFENERIVSYFKLKKNKVITVYNGVGSHFKPVINKELLAQAKIKYNLPNDFLFFLGNTDPKKNVIGVLKALDIIDKAGKMDFKLVMLDINRDYLSNLVNQIGNPDLLKYINFTGYVKNSELPAIYSQADLFLYPSLRESFGIPLLEGMACGVPVITSNTSSMPEIAHDAAFLIDPFNPETIANAIIELRNNPKLKKQLSEKGIKRAADFSWANNARQTISIYEHVLKHN